MMKYGQVPRVVLGELAWSQERHFCAGIPGDLSNVFRIRANKSSLNGRAFKGNFNRMGDKRFSPQKPDILMGYGFGSSPRGNE